MSRWFMVLSAAFTAVVLFWLAFPMACAQDPGWPRQAATPSGSLLIYQPQPTSLKGDMLAARSAISITPKRKKNPIYGCAWFTSQVMTNRDTRTVSLVNTKVTSVRFPNTPASQAGNLSKVVKTALPQLNLTISLDRLLASLQADHALNGDPDDLSTAPPRIIYVNYPAVLITLDGQPLLRPVSGSALMRVVNTPFFMVLDPATNTYYLYGSGNWYSSGNILAGPWVAGAQPPTEVLNLQKQVQVQGAQQAVAAGSPPQVIVSTVPAELISSNGDPVYTPVVGGQLLYMSNTAKDVFLETSTQTYYVLLSGRWYVSKSLNGPWSYVPADSLPASFASIPANSPKARIRASVAGTQEAADALADAQIPQTAVISRNSAGPNVSYDGDPRFRSIEGTDTAYAFNTGYQVLKTGGVYYCCYQGVWYRSVNPLGPWSVAVTLPSELPLIPPSCPLYNTQFCTIYRYTGDMVYVGYTPGYLGCYPFGPTVVWGTGWYYPGWYGSVYYPWPLTWGCGAGYVPWTGSWAFGIGFAPDWFNFGFGWGFDWDDFWGPCGFRDFDIDFNHARVESIHRPFREPDLDLFGRPENLRRNAEHPQGRNLRPAPPAKHQQNNVFAERNGNIQRRTPQGWQQRQPNGWSAPVPPGAPMPGPHPAPAPHPTTPPSAPLPGPPPAPMHPLEPDSQARKHGQDRTNNFNRRYGGIVPHGASPPTVPGPAPGHGPGSRGGPGRGRSR